MDGIQEALLSIVGMAFAFPGPAYLIAVLVILCVIGALLDSGPSQAQVQQTPRIAKAHKTVVVFLVKALGLVLAAALIAPLVFLLARFL